MHIHRYGRKIYWVLPFPEMFLQTGGHLNNYPGPDRQNTGIQTRRLAR